VFSVRYELNLYIVGIYFSLDVARDMAQAVIHQPLTSEVLYVKLELSLANDSVLLLTRITDGYLNLLYIWTFSQLPLTE
jgi:hypothetical protein